MQPPPTPPNEAQRLATVRALGLLDTPPEERFDRLTRLAQQVLRVPIAAICLVDEQRQWFKSCQGLSLSETPREGAFCAHVILGDDVLVVRDARRDPRFADNFLVVGESQVVFYAGYPLRAANGSKVGTLTVMDHRPRRLSALHRQALRDVAALVESELFKEHIKQELIVTQKEEHVLRDAEAALRSAIQEQQHLLEAIPDLVHVLDLQGHLVRWNKQLEMISGFSAQELQGKPIFEIAAENSRAPILAAIGALIEQGWVEADWNLLTKDGRSLLYHARGVPLPDDQGNISGLLGISRDISEHRRVEAELQNARDVAETASRAKSDFVANMSHEIRTPMNGVIGMTGLLLGTDLSSEQREYVETIRASGDALLTIINDILDFSKIEAGRLELEHIDFDLRQIVEEAVDLLAENAQSKRLELACLIYHDVPTALRGDPGRLRQILTNLLSNAVKFTDQGEVIVRVSAREETDAAVLVRFEVVDTGIGIALHEQARLFQAFTQADTSTTRRYGGTGLGLVICKQLTELMGGDIGLESEPGKGSAFWFTVPLEKRSWRLYQAVQPRADLQGLRVLIIDDNATNRAILRQQVGSWGMLSDSTEGGVSGLARLRAMLHQQEPFDLAILDMQMPGMTGLDVARAIKADPVLARLHLVLLTSLGSSGLAEAARQAGITMCLTKPVRQSQLYDCLATVMATTSGATALPARLARETPPSFVLKETPISARILVAEDNTVNQRVAVRMLERLGYQADVVANGLEAVEATASVPYAAMLMDCQMPEMDGFEATRIIRERERRLSHLPIIAMTANVMEGDRERCLAAGMDDYVSKPVKIEELAAALQHWVRRGLLPAPLTMPPGEDDSIERNVVLARVGGDEALLQEIVRLFLDDCPKLMKEIHEAIVRGDAKRLDRATHTLKGSVGNFTTKAPFAAAVQLQDIARGGDLTDAQAVYAVLEAEVVRLMQALTAWA